ncbi:hypothetical protein DIRU0_B14180 [Diutina rugosa]
MDISPSFTPVMAQAWAELNADSDALVSRVGNAICKRTTITNRSGVEQDFQLTEMMSALSSVIDAISMNKPLPVGKLQRVACVNARVYEFDAAKYAVWGDSIASTLSESFDGCTRFDFSHHVVAFLSQFLELLLRLSHDEVLSPEPEQCPFREYRNSSLISESPSSASAVSIFSDNGTISTQASEPATPPPPSKKASRSSLSPRSVKSSSKSASKPTSPSKAPSSQKSASQALTPTKSSPKSRIRRSASHGSLQRLASFQPPTAPLPLYASLTRSYTNKTFTSKSTTQKSVSVKQMKASVCEPTELQGSHVDDTFDMINCFDIHQVDSKATRKKKRTDCVIT